MTNISMTDRLGVGSPLPDIRLPRLSSSGGGGGDLALDSLRGKRLLLFFWGSWWGCREQLPGWQQFYQAHRRQDRDDFELVSIALEHTGAQAARPYVDRAHTTFPTLVDEHGTTSTLFGFKVVPNGVLVDEAGTIRFARFGGFSIENPEDVAAVERFLEGGEPGPSPANEGRYTLGALERDLVETKLRLGRLLHSLGRREEAVAQWRAALHYDPDNLVIRKQLWAACYPERFHPAIDWQWQNEQRERERREEMAAGVCGPEGCPIPPKA